MLRALIDNAVKFSPPGSSVRLSTALEEKEAVVVVADDGPGISAKELPLEPDWDEEEADEEYEPDDESSGDTFEAEQQYENWLESLKDKGGR